MSMPGRHGRPAVDRLVESHQEIHDRTSARAVDASAACRGLLREVHDIGIASPFRIDPPLAAGENGAIPLRHADIDGEETLGFGARDRARRIRCRASRQRA